MADEIFTIDPANLDSEIASRYSDVSKPKSNSSDAIKTDYENIKIVVISEIEKEAATGSGFEINLNSPENSIYALAAAISRLDKRLTAGGL